MITQEKSKSTLPIWAHGPLKLISRINSYKNSRPLGNGFFWGYLLYMNIYSYGPANRIPRPPVENKYSSKILTKLMRGGCVLYINIHAISVKLLAIFISALLDIAIWVSSDKAFSQPHFFDFRDRRPSSGHPISPDDFSIVSSFYF